MNVQHQKVEETSLFVEYLIKELHGAKVYSEEQRAKYLKEKSLRIKLQQVVEETKNLEAQLKDVEGLDALLQRAEETIFLQEKEMSQLSAKLESKENENQSLWIKFEGLKDKLERANVHSEEQKKQFHKEREKCLEEEQSLRIKLQQQVEETKKLEAQLKDVEELETLLQRGVEAIFLQEAQVCQLSAKLESKENENQSLLIKFEDLKDKLERANVHSEEQKSQFHKEREKCLEEEQSLRIKLQKQVEETKKLEAQLKDAEEFETLLQTGFETIFSQEEQVSQLSAKLESKENENQSLWIQVEDLKEKLERANVHSEEQKCQFHKEREKCLEEEQSLRVKLQQQVEETKKLEAQLKDVGELEALLQRGVEAIFLQEAQVCQLSAKLESKENENQSLLIKFEDLKDKLERANVHSEEQKSQFHKEREKCLKEEQSLRIKLQKQVEETKKLEAQLKDAEEFETLLQTGFETIFSQEEQVSQLSAKLESKENENQSLWIQVEDLKEKLERANVHTEEQKKQFHKEREKCLDEEQSLRVKLQQQVKETKKLEAQLKVVEELDPLLQRAGETIFLQEEQVCQLSAKLESKENENQSLLIKFEDLKDKLEKANVHAEEQKKLFHKEREKCLDEEQSLRFKLQQQVEETKKLEVQLKVVEELDPLLQRAGETIFLQEEQVCHLSAKLESKENENQSFWVHIEDLTDKLERANVHAEEQKSQFHKEREKYLEEEQMLRITLQQQIDETKNLEAQVKDANEKNAKLQRVEETSLFQKECISQLSTNLQSQKYENKTLWSHIDYLTNELQGAKDYSEEQRAKYLTEQSLRIKLQQVVEETKKLEAQLKDTEELDVLLQRAEETISLRKNRSLSFMQN
ncbi:trichohyalin-like [Mugil cephalus]|uniref:trichohyalin-like n=1 Tax=Mugil cephalus TaxID=48193 RepID=UPI001FB7EB78|nr:trichohyalin-like [Mugil cephalus]